jgi:ARG and Rhodanese-Phosphatase-superfamily-associated Protein domain
MSTLLEAYLSRIELGEPQQFNNVVVVPIFTGGSGAPEYLTLSEALQQQLASITEIHTAGAVPQVKVTNLADALLLLVDGEELIGARQNRTLNTSILVTARSEILVPVSCTEAGRWAYKSPVFADAGFVSPHKLRRTKSNSVTASLLRNRGHTSDQQAVWQAVDHLCACGGTKSPTHAMFDALAAKAEELQSYLHGLKPLPGQKGLAVLVNGIVVGVDTLSSARAYQGLHPRFIRSYAMEALLNQKPAEAGTPREQVQAFFESGKASAETVHPAVGRGEDHRFRGQGVAGAALVADGNVLHLNLYRN